MLNFIYTFTVFSLLRLLCLCSKGREAKQYEDGKSLHHVVSRPEIPCLEHGFYIPYLYIIYALSAILNIVEKVPTTLLYRAVVVRPLFLCLGEQVDIVPLLKTSSKLHPCNNNNNNYSVTLHLT